MISNTTNLKNYLKTEVSTSCTLRRIRHLQMESSRVKQFTVLWLPLNVFLLQPQSEGLRKTVLTFCVTKKLSDPFSNTKYIKTSCIYLAQNEEKSLSLLPHDVEHTISHLFWMSSFCLFLDQVYLLVSFSWSLQKKKWLVLYRRTMPLAERLSSEFHSCRRSVASRPTVHFSDNLSASGIILRYTRIQKGFIVYLDHIWDMYSFFRLVHVYSV